MEITRRQGRVVIVGYVKLDIHPKNFLYREIDLRYSRAYGPGSYDTSYEKGRVDYPFGYVRWTEKRNLEEFIRLVAAGAVNLEPLIAGIYPVDRAQEPFDAIRERTLPGVAALISYGASPDLSRTIQVNPRPKREGKVGISLIGFGNHVLGMHLPNLKSMRDVELRGIASATGRNASVAADGLGATMITTDVDELLADEGTDAVMICSNQPDHYRAHPGGDLGRQGRVHREADGHPARRLQRVAQADGGRSRPSSRSDSTAATRPSSTTLRKSIDGPGRLRRVPDHPAARACRSLEPRPGRRRRAAGQRGRAFHRSVQPADRQAPGIGVRPGRWASCPTTSGRCATSLLTLHYEGAAATVVFNECGVPGFPRERLIGVGPRAGVRSWTTSRSSPCTA